jgi:hypothetical protein
MVTSPICHGKTHSDPDDVVHGQCLAAEQQGGLAPRGYPFTRIGHGKTPLIFCPSKMTSMASTEEPAVLISGW